LQVLTTQSWDAALYAAGAVVEAVDEVRRSLTAAPAVGARLAAY